ncbi:MAG: hypothetical protein JRI76_01460 [Deltaproteobacteria bacterium]|nr:hypothetical protein [Deltaproteobacteria bacterium]MBW2040677.1 hypothetical protein [Deltaproteobacteria bacterium]
MKKIGILTLTRKNSLAYAALKQIVLELDYEPICGQSIGAEALFMPMEEVHLVGYDFLGPFFQKAGFSDADCILISAPYTASLFSLPKVIRALRAVSPAPVVLGGNEVSNNYRNLMEYRFIPFVHTLEDVGPDFIVRGAAEWALKLLLRLLDKTTLRRRWTADFVKQLLDIPNLVFWIPERSALFATRSSFTELPEEEIFTVVKYGEKTAAVTFQRACGWAKKSRGGCLFCAIAAHFGKDFHCAVKSDFFVRQLVFFLKTHETVRTVDIWDDTFNIDEWWPVRICGYLAEVNRRIQREITYTCFLRPKGITPELLARLKAVNIKAAFIGADAVTGSLSRRLRRGNTVQELQESLHMLSRSGIRYNISVQLFSPESTLEDVETTAALALQHIKDGRSSVHVHLYTYPLFGSAVHALLNARKNLKSIPAPLMRTAGDSGYEALPVAYDYRHYDPEVETIKQKTCHLLGVEASFFVRTYPGGDVDAHRLKEVLEQIRAWCIDARQSHPVKSFWYLSLLFLEGDSTGLPRDRLVDLLARNEPETAIPEALRKSHGDFGYRFTLSRSVGAVTEGLLKERWIRETEAGRYLLTDGGRAKLLSMVRGHAGNRVVIGAYGGIDRDAFVEMLRGRRPVTRPPMVKNGPFRSNAFRKPGA